ncbi:MAG TPA: hypothetical protein VLB76_15750 [Thermoanaerobaculia bacterium]|nr:hypothetical protein [Thermoanaerobaculia bacterium]
MRKEVIKAYISREPILKAVAALFEQEIHDTLAGVTHIDRISCRYKSHKSFMTKAFDTTNVPPYTDPLQEIEDQIAARVIVFFLSDIPIVRSHLEKAFTTVEYRRRKPDRDESFGYESEHMICVIPPNVKTSEWLSRSDMPVTAEVQIRTIFMHAYAEPQHDLAYKGADELPSEVRRELAWIAASAWGADHAYERFFAWYRSRVGPSNDSDDVA